MEKAETVFTHHDLDVWKISLDFVENLYQMTENFPQGEKYGLISQIRRAGISVPSNIAEGAARGHKNEFLQFLYYSNGSLSEIETQLEIALRLKMVSSIDDQRIMIKRIRMMIRGLIKKLKT